MTAYLGRNLTLKRGTWSGGTVVTQVRANTVDFGNGQIDITNKDSAGWRTLMEGGTKQASISVEGIVDNSAVFKSFKADSLAGTIGTYSIGNASTGLLEGSFQVSSYSESSPHDTELTFSATLESSGTITITAGV